ncbi:MAG: DNA primase [Candidatus Izemoplasmatales bacterium]|jgi:DNA primase|nr:DNA primase [Candidatus Izemoplasmatales bacterium]
MARYSQSKVEEIKNTADIVDVVSEFVSLQQAGKNMKGLCPFHNEKTPSFFVSKERQLFNCFGCGEKGNVIQFVSKYKHLDYWDSVKFLADKYGIEPDGFDDVKKNDNRTRYFRINELAKQFFTLQLLNLESGQTAVDYLKTRGFDEQTLSHFEIGFAPKQGNLLYENLSKDFHDYELIELGLIGKNDNDYYDLFRNKIMFPIHDENSRVVGFSGRIFNNEENTAKYVNSTQTEVFTKSDILYNLDKAIPFINQNKRIILTEGFFDVMSCYSADVKEAVCSMGTALTVNQAKLIKKYTDNVVVCYDGDDAGVRAAYKALVILGQAGLDVKICVLPDQMDPDDYIKNKSKEGFRNLLKNNLMDQYDFVYQMIVSKNDLKKPAEIEKAKLAIFEYLDKVASSTIREIYLKKFSNDTSVNYEDILADYHNFQMDNAKLRNIRQRQDAVKKASTEKRLTKKAVDSATKSLISYYALFPESREIIDSRISAIKIDNNRLKQLLLTLNAMNRNDGLVSEIQIKKDFNDISEEELKLFKKKDNFVFNETELIDCIETLMENYFDYEINQIQDKLYDSTLKKEDSVLLIQKMFEYQKNVQSIRRKRHVKKTGN